VAVSFGVISARRTPGPRPKPSSSDALEAVDVLGLLTATLRSASYRPPLLPATAMKLLELARKHETTFRDLLAILESDPFVAGQVLRIARSPAYTRAEPVRSLEQALTRLGITALTQIFMQVVVTSRVFRAPGYAGPMEMLREHSVAVAHAARLICRHTAVAGDVAFLCGLLHDVGAALALAVLGDEPPQTQPPFGEAVERAVEQVRIEAATLACEAWSLPADVAEVITHHHEPFSHGVANPMGCVVLLADYLASTSGIPGLSESFQRVELAQTSLGLSETAWRIIAADYQSVLGAGLA
jgi:HD-like signal output (HDOD) protein